MEVLCEPPIFVKALPKGLNPPYNKLSLTNLDQLLCYHCPTVLFYRFPGTCNGKKAADPAGAVRHGVEEMVACHYPWAAGQMRAGEHGDEEHHFEICIDEDGGPGVQFVSATANCPLAQLGDLSYPNPTFEPLFAKVDGNTPLLSRPLIALQVTKFQDGGFCVSMNWNHALFDGVAASIFLQNTSSCARGEGVCIQLDRAPRELRIKPVSRIVQPGWSCLSYEPCKEDLTAEQQSYSQPLAATRFEFSQADLMQLRLQALSKHQDCNIGFKTCSRFQVLAAHLWRAKARSMRPLRQDPSLAFPLRIVVNLRERVVADIPHNYMGNAFFMATALTGMEELKQKSLGFAVEKVQEAIAQVTPERFQSELDYLRSLNGNARITPAFMTITSLMGLGFYKADFGWGNPSYFGRLHTQPRNRFVILDGNAHCTTVNVLAAFDSQEELERFQDALHLGLVGSSDGQS